MDLVLEVCDYAFFDQAYAKMFPAPMNFTNIAPGDVASYNWLPPTKEAHLSSLPRDNIFRQFMSLWMVTYVFGVLLYFFIAGLSYAFVFDKATFNHPKFLKNQVRMEIRQSMEALPVMGLYTAVCFLAEVRGWSKLYMNVEDHGWGYFAFQFPLFLLFTDALIYLIHRGLHHKLVYKRLHKPHHKWIMPTPFASHAFHPVDGFAQSIPYHLFPFVFPLQKFAYLALFTFINIWTVMIHDGEYMSNNVVLNSAACHSVHHLYFNHNYGQYTTFWDRIGGSYRKPADELFDEKLKMNSSTWAKQVTEMETVVKGEEGADDRVYLSGDKKQQ